jgi:tRNA-dihydrouridine synthase
MYLKKLKIRDVELENNIILAPMAGVTDLPFRIICKKYGIFVAYSDVCVE